MKKIASVENLFCLVIFSMPLYLFRISVFDLPTNVFEVLAILAIVFFFIINRVNFVESFWKLPRIFIVAVSLMLIGVLLSIFFNNAYLTGFSILKSWFLIPILFSFLLYTVLDSENSIEKVYMSIYFSAVFVGVISIIYKIAGIVTYDNRLEAFYSSPNYLSMYLAPGIFFGFYFLTKAFNNKLSFYKTLSHIFLLMLIFIPLYYTYSYGAWLATCLSLFFILVFTINKKHLLTLGLFSMLIAAVFIFQTNSQKFLNLFSERSSLASRSMVWDASTLMIKQHPILGIGPGNFQAKYLSLQEYFPPYLQWAVPEPHNIFLAFWIQAGLLGLLGFLLLLFFVFHALLNVLKTNNKSAVLAAPIFGFFIYTVLHGLVDTPYWKNDLSFLFWVCAFLTLSVYNVSKEKNDFS